MKKQVFIINGSGGVGKDTFVELVSENFLLPVMNFSSVDKVKEVARIIGWTGGKSEKDRKFLSDKRAGRNRKSKASIRCQNGSH